MTLEVIEMSPDHWNVYYSIDPDERCCCTDESRERYSGGCGEIVFTFRGMDGAHRFAKALRDPGVYRTAVAHMNTIRSEPRWVKECGCHEGVDGLWYSVCAVGRLQDSIRDEEWGSR